MLVSMRAMSAETASTATAAYASVVLLDRSRMTVIVTAICVRHSAQICIATVEICALSVETGISLLRTGRDVSPALMEWQARTATASFVYRQSSLASTQSHVRLYAIDVCHAQTLRCLTHHLAGFLQLVLCVSPVRPGRHLLRRMYCVKYAHQVNTRRWVSAVAIVRLGKSQMWLSLVSGPHIAQRASTAPTATMMAPKME